MNFKVKYVMEMIEAGESMLNRVDFTKIIYDFLTKPLAPEEYAFAIMRGKLYQLSSS